MYINKKHNLISNYPIAVDPETVGKYPALTKSGGGYFYNDVLEYRVWVHSNNDYFLPFSTYEHALDFSTHCSDAEEPLVLVLQKEWIDEPTPGKYIHKTGSRITEWKPEWLEGNKRKSDTFQQFLLDHSHSNE
jgi:hypothetical protein